MIHPYWPQNALNIYQFTPSTQMWRICELFVDTRDPIKRGMRRSENLYYQEWPLRAVCSLKLHVLHTNHFMFSIAYYLWVVYYQILF